VQITKYLKYRIFHIILVHRNTYVESDILKYLEFCSQFDYIETISKMRVMSQKRNKRIYNYVEYLIHCEPGDYEGILLFKTPNGITALSTQVTVYNRGTARYFVFNTIDPDKKLIMVFLKKLQK